jgi:hypothetical protein
MSNIDKWPSPLKLKLFATHKLNEMHQNTLKEPTEDYGSKAYFYSQFHKVFNEIIEETVTSHLKHGHDASPYKDETND